MKRMILKKKYHGFALNFESHTLNFTMITQLQKLVKEQRHFLQSTTMC